MIRRCILACALVFANLSVAFAASPLALSCLGCHQPAVDDTEMPALNRQSAAQIAAWLRRSRDAPAFGSIMARFTSALDDAQIERLAAELGDRGPVRKPVGAPAAHSGAP